MQAVIMAGGEGSRLRPLTCNRPKPMVPVLNKPIMEHIIELLGRHGFTSVLVTLQFLPRVIMDYFGDGSPWGVNLQYFIEEKPLGTAGSVKNIEEHLEDTFLVISGDALTGANLTSLVEFHRRSGGLATLALVRVENPLEYGVVITGRDGRITRFLEKPGWGEVFSDTVNTGIYVLGREALRHVERGRPFDFSKDLFPRMLKEGCPIYGWVTGDYWCDVGNLEQYRQAHLDALGGKIRLAPPGEELEPGIWAGPGVSLASGVHLRGPLVLGEGTRVERGVSLEPYTVIGRHSRLREGSSLKRSILWDGVYVGRGVELRGAILGKGVKIKDHAAVFEGAVVGDDSVAGVRSILKPEVKVWPSKVVDAATVVNSSLVWGTRSSRSLFGREGIRGTANVDLTVDMAARLGGAFAALVGAGARVVAGDDGHPFSRALGRAAASGLAAAGARVMEMGPVTGPAARFAVRLLQARGGLYVKTEAPESDKVTLQFFDGEGLLLSRGEERKIEGTLERGDVPWVPAGEVPPSEYFPGIMDAYRRWLLDGLDAGAIRLARWRLVAAFGDPGGGPLGRLVTPLLEDLGCELIPVPGTGLLELGRGEGCPDLGALVKARKADLGMAFSQDGEQVRLWDHHGRAVSDEQHLALLALLALEREKGATVVVPVHAPRAVEELARRYGGRVVRCQTSPRALMEKLLPLGERRLSLQCDALAMALTLLEHLSRRRDSLAGLMDELPGIYVARRSVECPWKAKGRVMRQLLEEVTAVEETGGEGAVAERVAVETVDGLRLTFKRGWALVLPDAEEPVYRVIGEGEDWEVAESLAEDCIERINRHKEAGSGHDSHFDGA